MADKTFYVIDGHSHIYRAFHALPESMMSPSGQPTNAVFGFTSMLMKLLREKSPDYLAVALDRGKPKKRLELFEDYKATRKPMPDNLRSQIPLVEKVLEAMNIPICVIEDQEADDVIATLAKAARKDGLTVYIVTGDKDLFQLIDDSTYVCDTMKNLVFDEKAAVEKYGIRPDQLGDWLALVGDTSDNVPGVQGIGPKGATDLIKEFGSLDAILENPGAIKQKGLRKKIEENADSARMSRKLVELNTALDIGVSISDCKTGTPDGAAMKEVFSELGFRKLAAEFSQSPDKIQGKYETITDERSLDTLVKKLAKAKELAVDTETTSLLPHEAELVGISVSVKEREAAYIPVGGEGKHLERDEVISKLKPVLEDENISKTGQNIKYDMCVLANYGVELAGVSFDTMIAAYVLNPARRGYGIDELAFDFLELGKTSFKEVVGKKKTLAEVSIDDVAPYACEDADAAFRLERRLRPLLEEQGFMSLFSDCEMPLVGILAEMQRNGIALDTKYLEELGIGFGSQMEQLQKKIWSAAGGEFNVSSTKQLAEVLFEKLGLTPGKKTKTGFSTDVKVLTHLAREHEVPAMVLEFRHLSKLKSTYVDALVEATDSAGKVHASFNQTATATGRLSSSDPNLQNIPIRTEEGRKIRRAFVPSGKEMVLLSCDYSQIELRFLAHLCEDKAMRDAFSNNEDIHTRVAAEIFGVAQGLVTEDMRRAAKTVNFGIIYGQTPYGLSEQLAISVSEAKDFIDRYFKRYPGARNFIERTIEDVRMDGFVTTILGRKRPIPEINAKNQMVRQYAERAAVNTVIQGSAADLMKLAMIAVHGRIREERNSRMLVQVHDELLFEVPESTAGEEARMIEEEMTGAMELSVPLRVDMKTGNNWAEV